MRKVFKIIVKIREEKLIKIRFILLIYDLNYKNYILGGKNQFFLNLIV